MPASKGLSFKAFSSPAIIQKAPVIDYNLRQFTILPYCKSIFVPRLVPLVTALKIIPPLLGLWRIKAPLLKSIDSTLLKNGLCHRAGRQELPFTSRLSDRERGCAIFSYLWPSFTTGRNQAPSKFKRQQFWSHGGVCVRPQNPYVPTAHMNVRFFQAQPLNGQLNGQPVCWFGS